MNSGQKRLKLIFSTFVLCGGKIYLSPLRVPDDVERWRKTTCSPPVKATNPNNCGQTFTIVLAKALEHVTCGEDVSNTFLCVRLRFQMSESPITTLSVIAAYSSFADHFPALLFCIVYYSNFSTLSVLFLFRMMILKASRRWKPSVVAQLR